MRKRKKEKMTVEELELTTSALYIATAFLLKEEDGSFEFTGNKFALLIAASELTEEMLQGRKLLVRSQLREPIKAYKKAIKNLAKRKKEMDQEREKNNGE